MISQPIAMDAGLARLSSVNLNLLVPLLALLEERSVTRAAEKVGLSQPAMSHALRRLRRLLGDELLVRQGSAMRLTPLASELAVPLERLLRETAHLVHGIRFDPATTQRVVSIALASSTALFLGGVTGRLLAERAPNAQLRLFTAPPTDAVFSEQGADVALISQVAVTGWGRERLYDDRWVVITRADPPSDADAVTLISTLPHAVYEAPADGSHILPYRVLDQHQVPYRIQHHITDHMIIPSVVAATGGVGMVRYRVATALRDHFDLRIEEFPFPIPGLGIDLVWNPWLSDQAYVAWLRALLMDAAAAAS